MREIKFRAWHIKTSQMSTNTQSIIDIYENDAGTNAEDVIFLQFTGLHDKNGKEIYEGDIVRILYTDWPSKAPNDPRSIDEYKNDIAHTMVVIWSYNGFYVSPSTDGYADDIDPGRHGFIEVIGNIYEHGELL